MAVVVTVIPQQGRRAFTEVCGIFSPSLHDPPLQPQGNSHLGNHPYHCPRCDTTYSRSHTVKQHFPRCIETNGNPSSLRWFDHESNNVSGTKKQNKVKATVTSSKSKRKIFSIASLLEDDPESIMAMTKVGKWAAMAAEKQAAAVASTSDNPNGIDTSATHNPTAVTASLVDTSSHHVTPEVNKSVVTPTRTINKGRPIITPASKQKQPIPRKPRKSKRINHDEYTAHLFNNAGRFMPSIPGIDSVTERLFDRGEIMSLEPSRSHENYYTDGEPRGGSFIVGQPCERKRKRDDQS